MHDTGNLYFHDVAIQMLISFGNLAIFDSSIEFPKQIPVRNPFFPGKIMVSTSIPKASASSKQPCCVRFSPASSPRTPRWLP